MGSDVQGTTNDCAKAMKSWIFTSGNSDILCNVGMGSGMLLVGCSAAGEGLSMDSLKESVTLENNFVRAYARRWRLYSISEKLLT